MSENIIGRSLNQPPFIPIWMDDLALSPHAFRVLCHLWRRVDLKKGPPWRCWPGSKSIAKACCMKRQTVFNALKEIEACGILVREKDPHRFNGNTYTLGCAQRGDVPPNGTTPAKADGLNKGVVPNREMTPSGGCPPKGDKGWSVSGHEGWSVSGHEGWSVSGHEGCAVSGHTKVPHEGSPIKVPQLRGGENQAPPPVSQADETDAPIPFPFKSWDELPATVRDEFKTRYLLPKGDPVPEGFWQTAFNRYRVMKVKYADKLPADDWPHDVANELHRIAKRDLYTDTAGRSSAAGRLSTDTDIEQLKRDYGANF